MYKTSNQSSKLIPFLPKFHAFRVSRHSSALSLTIRLYIQIFVSKHIALTQVLFLTAWSKICWRFLESDIIVFCLSWGCYLCFALPLLPSWFLSFHEETLSHRVRKSRLHHYCSLTNVHACSWSNRRPISSFR